MKKKIIVIVMILFVYSCQEKNKVELMPNAEMEYTIIESKPWEREKSDVFSFEYDQIKKWSEAIREVQKNIKIEDDSEDFEYALYINEMGKIDKIKPLKSSNPEIDQFLAEEMNNWQMVKHLENETPHKYRIDLNFTIWKNKEGIMNVINSNFPIIDDYKGEDFITYTDKMPEPINGVKGIQEKIVYPKDAKKQGVEGRVYIKAYISKEGNVVTAQVMKGIGSGCDEAAIEAVKNTKFIPASWDGKPVGAQVAIPILFKLSNAEEKK